MPRALLAAILVAFMLLSGCSGQKPAPISRTLNPATAPWDEIVSAARGSTVRFYMWGGSDTINRWVDGYVTRRMSELYGVRVERVPMNAPDFVNKLLTEKQAGQSQGSRIGGADVMAHPDKHDRVIGHGA